MTKTRFYRIWFDMRRRCENKNNKSFPIYGGKGIKCEWKSFEHFKKDMYLSYCHHVKKHGELDTTIERRDNNLNYRKSNCRWATKHEQSRNMSTNRLITFKGKTQILADWSKELNINHTTIIARLKNGWSVEKTFSTRPKKGSNQFTV